jgi:hypothetical protein
MHKKSSNLVLGSLVTLYHLINQVDSVQGYSDSYGSVVLQIHLADETVVMKRRRDQHSQHNQMERLLTGPMLL